MQIYKIQINTTSNQIANQLNELLNLHGKLLGETQWYYEVEENENDEYFDFVTIFSKILHDNFERLEMLGIMKDDISIWYLYEYEQQCNMEFDTSQLNDLASLGITFCISCWKRR